MTTLPSEHRDAPGGYAATLKAGYAARRARLFAGPPKLPALPPVPKPEPEPEPEPAPEPPAVVEEPAAEDPVRVHIIACEEVEPPLVKPMAWKDIVREVAQQHGRGVSIARQEAMYRLKTETLMSLKQIGNLLGKRDHTTVLWGVQQHEQRMSGAKPRKPATKPNMHFWTPEKLEAAIAMRMRGYTFQRISDRLGAKSAQLVRGKLKRIGALEEIEAQRRSGGRR